MRYYSTTQHPFPSWIWIKPRTCSLWIVYFDPIVGIATQQRRNYAKAINEKTKSKQHLKLVKPIFAEFECVGWSKKEEKNTRHSITFFLPSYSWLCFGLNFSSRPCCVGDEEFYFFVGHVFTINIFGNLYRWRSIRRSLSLSHPRRTILSSSRVPNYILRWPNARGEFWFDFFYFALLRLIFIRLQAGSIKARKLQGLWLEFQWGYTLLLLNMRTRVGGIST